jgi:hypothetical protein
MSGDLEAAKRLPLRQVPSVKQLLINDHARDQHSRRHRRQAMPARRQRPSRDDGKRSNGRFRHRAHWRQTQAKQNPGQHGIGK